MRVLIDTNIILEIILNREKSKRDNALTIDLPDEMLTYQIQFDVTK
jgi:predicted nucleic acid-binding protein